jgi:exodeoxyribonuclease-1
MSEFSFFWHDYETFGRVPSRDWPAQFAGVRTNAQLEEVEPPVVHFCRPPRDRLPDPESCLITGLVPQVCENQGLPEHAFAAEIERALTVPGTVGAGYNSLRFDDEVTRFLFWRNLLDPYAREWRNDCGRWDLLDTVRCAFALRPEGIEWPQGADGRTSFRLELLTAANGLDHGSAHEALSDVRATIALARLIRARQPRLWDFCVSLRRKDKVVEQLAAGRPVLHVSGRYPVQRGCIAIVWPFAPHPVHRNEVIVWDLMHDPQELMSMTAQEVRARLFVRDEDLPPDRTRLPLKTIHLNRAPVVTRHIDTLTDERAQHWGIDKAQVWRHAQTAARIAGPLAGLWPGVYERTADRTPADVDEDLYGGFLEDGDRNALRRARQMYDQGSAAALPAFGDSRLEELVFRYRARNFPQALTPQDAERWQAHCRERLHEGRGGLALADFQDKLDRLSETADDRGLDILGALSDWATEIAP